MSTPPKHLAQSMNTSYVETACEKRVHPEQATAHFDLVTCPACLPYTKRPYPKPRP